MKTRESLEKELEELQQAYQELQIKEERYRLITERTNDVIWTQKLDGTITYLSQAVEKLRGLTVEEAMHQSPEDILTPASLEISTNYLLRQYELFLSGLPLESFRGEIDYYRKDRSILHTEVITYPIEAEEFDSVAILGVSRDIGERKQFETQLHEQAESLKKLNATKDKFFSIIANDLKNPFNAIFGLIGLLKASVERLDYESVKEYADLVLNSAQQTYSLLEDLLDWARIQQNTYTFTPETISATTLLMNEKERFRKLAEQKQIRLELRQGEDVMINADEKMISTIIRNLISNAIKFTPANGKITLSVNAQEHQVEISVRDTGIGMTRGQIGQLFLIEKSTSRPGTANEQGTGLGLILCYELTKLHGGNIGVESKHGKGCRFYFSLPVNR